MTVQQFTDTEKLCADCEQWKPRDQFSPKTNTSSGLNSYCRVCQRRRSAECHDRLQTPERAEATRLKRRKRTVEGYGITLAEYEAILERQGGGCVCGVQHPGGRWRHFHVDHDHATGRVRGVLCHHCNTALGLLDESVDRVATMLAYLLDGGS